ncbi:MAG TPA: hypothetical protein DHW79_10905, partial [Candidatus Cloacimonas sp.]|nr:hypothetical protein [Candidatus Cloacimonas sp.]
MKKICLPILLLMLFALPLMGQESGENQDSNDSEGRRYIMELKGLDNLENLESKMNLKMTMDTGQEA